MTGNEPIRHRVFIGHLCGAHPRLEEPTQTELQPNSEKDMDVLGQS